VVKPLNCQRGGNANFSGVGCEHAHSKLLLHSEIAQPQKNQRCLILAASAFLIYPWRDWQAFFYGQEISTVGGCTQCPWFSAELKAI